MISGLWVCTGSPCDRGGSGVIMRVFEFHMGCKYIFSKLNQFCLGSLALYIEELHTRGAPTRWRGGAIKERLTHATPMTPVAGLPVITAIVVVFVPYCLSLPSRSSSTYSPHWFDRCLSYTQSKRCRRRTLLRLVCHGQTHPKEVTPPNVPYVDHPAVLQRADWSFPNHFPHIFPP